MISHNTIEQVKNTANVVDIVGQYVKLKKVGANMVGSCPFHDEKSPSFSVSKEKNMYKCFGCNASGDSIGFIQKHLQKTFVEAIEIIAAYYNITIENDAPQPRRTYTKPQAAAGEITPPTLKYFESRGISKEVLDELKVTQWAEWMPKAKAVVDTICFNYYRNGELVNIKYRAKDKDFKLSKDAELIFYNLDSMKGRDYVVIVEGEIDCLSVRQAGVKSVVSVPNGAATGNQRLEYLDNCFELFLDKKQIIIMTDNDNPGMNLRDELARRFGYDKCFKVIYPDGCKDANEILTKYGAAKLSAVIKGMVEFPVEGIFSIADLEDDIRNFYNNGYPSGEKAGIPNFDEHIQFMGGQFTTWTGIPGSGKSEFTDYVAMELAKNKGWIWGECSFENQPSSLHVTKLMEKYVTKSFARRYDDADRISPVELDDALQFIEAHFYFVNINKVDVTLDGILLKFKELVLRKGVNAFVIDPWNYIEHKGMAAQSETNYVSECLTKIKAFCLAHNVHLFLIAHPTKMAKVNGKYEIPTLYNVSGSAHFFNKTDNGVTVYRNFTDNTVEVYIQKVRYSWLGKIGMVQFTYDIDRRRYLPIGTPESEKEFASIPDNPRAGFQRPDPAKQWNND